MKVNISTLESMGDWEIVNQDESINVVDLKWYFKCKRYPDILIKKIQSSVFARGG